MSDEKPVNHLYYFSLRLGTYTGISFLTALGIISPITRGATTLIIIGYGLYIAYDCFRAYSEIEKSGGNRNKVLRAAIAFNGLEIVLFFLALLAGILVGLGL